MGIKSMFRRLFSRKQKATSSPPAPPAVYPRSSSANSRTYSSAPVASDDSAVQNLMLMGMMMPGVNRAVAVATYAVVSSDSDSDSRSYSSSSSYESSSDSSSSSSSDSGSSGGD